MTAQSIFYIIIAILIVDFIIDSIIGYLNAQKFDDPIPEALEDVYQKEEYEKSQAYKLENYKFSNITGVFSLVLTLGFLMLDGFDYVDHFARLTTSNPILITLIFFGVITLGSDIITTPFSYYHTFVIEEKYGFNKSSIKTFILDKLKGWLMMVILGGGILALIVWFYQVSGSNFWLYTWGLVAVFTLLINMFYSRVIVPIFNKQTPLKEGSLKSKIHQYAAQVGFQLDNIYVIDGSKRS